LLIHLPPIGLMTAALEQRLIDAERAGFSDAPAMHLLAADAVLEARLALEHEDAVTALGHALRQRRTGEAAAHDDQIVDHRFDRLVDAVREVWDHRRGAPSTDPQARGGGRDEGARRPRGSAVRGEGETSLAAGAGGLGQRLEDGDRVLPGETGVGDALAVDERLAEPGILAPPDQVALEHDADDVGAPVGELAGQVAGHLRLARMILPAVAV